MPVLVLGVVAPFAMDYYRAKRLESLVEDVGGTVELERNGPDWLWDAASEYGFENWRPFLLTRVTRVALNGTSIDDRWLRNLASFHEIERLGLARTKATDEGLLSLGPLSRLVTLDVSGSEIHGSGLNLLENSPNLEYLFVERCPLQSGKIDSRLELPKLKLVSFLGTGIVTEDCLFLAKSRRLSRKPLPERKGFTHPGLIVRKRLVDYRKFDTP